MSKNFRNQNKEMYRNYKYWNYQTQTEDKNMYLYIKRDKTFNNWAEYKKQ